MTQHPEITVERDEYAPPSDRWYAFYGDLDIDTVTGHGATPLDAIRELLDLSDD